MQRPGAALMGSAELPYELIDSRMMVMDDRLGETVIVRALMGGGSKIASEIYMS